MTADHSTILIDGKGQKGEGKTWFDFSPWLLERGAPQILSVRTSPDADVIVCDVAPAYPSDLGLKKFIRTFRFQKPDQLEVTDELEARKPALFESRFQVNGTLQKISGADYHLTQDEVTARLTVIEGSQWTISMLDTGAGRCLCVSSRRKQLKAQFTILIRVEDGSK